LSIQERLQDAELMRLNGHYGGTLLSVLIAVAATSRRRYPKNQFNSDGVAFKRFLLDELPVYTTSNWIPSCEEDYLNCIIPTIHREREMNADLNEGEEPVVVKRRGWWFKVPGSGIDGWKEEMMPICVPLYNYVRNNLVHEASMPTNVKFFEHENTNLVFDIKDDHIKLANSLVIKLATCVQYAPENKDEYPSINELPEDVLAWNLFNHRRDKQRDYLEARARRVANPSK
jgi:hypothetical protein